ncbi:MAG TPA: response regulator [Candidatus Hydrogenedentes bacterium]|nr:response regulator [Candidatus Hydrogenedentota bacterium]
MTHPAARLLPVFLLADDRPTLLDRLAGTLRIAFPGARFLLARNADETLRLAREERPDCAIIAIYMGGAEGIALCRRVKSDPGIDPFPILLITGRDTDAETRIAGLEAGADDILYRYASPEELAAKVRVMLRIRRAEANLRDMNRLLAAVAEERSRESQELQRRYRFFVDSMSDGFFAFTLEPDNRPGVLVEVNDIMARYLGYSSVADLVGLEMPRIVVPDRVATLSARVESILQHRALSFDTQLLARDGRLVPFRLTAALMELGETRQILNIARPLGGSPVEEAENYRFLASQTGMLIYDCDVRTGRIVWGGAISQLTGLPPEKIARLGWSRWQKFIHPEDRPRVLNTYQAALETVGKYEIDYRIARPDGSIRYVEDSGVALPASSGRAARVVGSIRDVTARVHAEQERRRIEERVQHSQRLESLGVLAGGIAHDFNNILAGIIGLTELALRDIPKTHRASQDLGEALQAANRARDLVRQILAFSRQGGQERSPVYLHVIAREAIKLLRATLPATIRVVDSVDVHSGAVLGNPAQLHQVIMNFCTNAAQAIGREGGTIEVTVRDEEVDEQAALTHPHLRLGPYVRLSVADTGHGMSPEVLARVFDPFFTTKKPGEGTGMGLAVVHGIIVDHGGAVMAESEPGRGSVFHAWLPRLSGIAPEPAENVVLPATPRGERILFVDDDPVVRRFAEQALGRLGYAVTVCRSGEEAEAVFSQQGGRFDLVITDRVMPGLSGDQLLERLRQQVPDLRAIIFTGFSDTLVPGDPVELPPRTRLLMKPASLSELVNAMLQVLAPGTSNGAPDSRPRGRKRRR